MHKNILSPTDADPNIVSSISDTHSDTPPRLTQHTKNRTSLEAHRLKPVDSDLANEIEFCQIELNALDWTLQDAKTKYDELTKRGIPVWVMEPVRGGRLASLSPPDEAALKSVRPNETISAWAFRWLQTLPRIGVTLSGMTTMEQLRDNVKTFSENKPLTEDEKRLYEDVIAALADKLPCTACRYCSSGCPLGLDIPNLLALYDDCRFAPSMVAKMAVDAMKPSKRPSACVACGKCREVCPQNIEIPNALRHFSELLAEMPSFVPPAEEDE